MRNHQPGGPGWLLLPDDNFIHMIISRVSSASWIIFTGCFRLKYTHCRAMSLCNATLNGDRPTHTRDCFLLNCFMFPMQTSPMGYISQSCKYTCLSIANKAYCARVLVLVIDIQPTIHVRVILQLISLLHELMGFLMEMPSAASSYLIWRTSWEQLYNE